MPTSISPSGRSKIGVPAAGGVHEDSATPYERAFSFTRRAMPATVGEVVAALGGRARDLLREHRRAHAAAARGVERVLHRHVVVDQHGLDLIPSSSASSAASLKFITSPV